MGFLRQRNSVFSAVGSYLDLMEMWHWPSGFYKEQMRVAV